MDKQQARKFAETYGPRPGEIYRHYKSGYYTVVGMAIKEDTLEPMVIYLSNTYGGLTVRSLAEWNRRNENNEARFARVEP